MSFKRKCENRNKVKGDFSGYKQTHTNGDLYNMGNLRFCVNGQNYTKQQFQQLWLNGENTV